MKIKLARQQCFISAVVLCLGGCAQEPDPAAPVAEPPPQQVQASLDIREITNVTGDLYRARSNNHYTVFLVTSAGIILADPINTAFATWLKAEFERRFAVPVRYVLYSHHHFDHASGGAVFADTAEFIGHENMLDGIRQGLAGLPESEVADDVNGNGRIERNEAAAALAAYFDDFDLDGDGSATGAEIMGAVLAPERTYADRMTVTLGGKTVELIHAGPSHSDDMTVLLFPAERAAFAVDFINVLRLPGPLDGASLTQWIASVGAMAALDFDIAIPGHGAIGTKADIIAYRRYFEDLQAAVTRGIEAGASVAELQQTIRLDAFQDWDRYDTQLALHIGEAYAGEVSRIAETAE